MHTLFKKKILQHIALHEATRVKRRPHRLYEGKPCLGKLTAQETALRKALGKLEDSFGSILQSMQPMKGTAHAVGPILNNIEMVF